MFCHAVLCYKGHDNKCCCAGASQRTYDTMTVNKVILAVLMSVPGLLDPSVVTAANDGTLYAVSLYFTRFHSALILMSQYRNATMCTQAKYQLICFFACKCTAAIVLEEARA